MLWLYLASQLGLSFLFSLITGAVNLLYVLMIGSAVIDGDLLLEIISNLITIFVTVLSALCAIWYASRKIKWDWQKSLSNFQYKKSNLLYGVSLCYGLSLPLGFLVTFLGLLLRSVGLDLPEVGASDNQFIAGELLYFIAGCIAAPILEEIVFRGIILGSLKQYSPKFALIFSSLLFTFMHMNLYQGIAVFGMGIAFGIMYLKTESLQVTIFMHFINNLIAWMNAWIPDGAATALSLMLLALMVIGWVYLIKNRKSIRSMLSKQGTAKDCWSVPCKSISFWMLALVFVLFSAFYIVGWMS